MTHFDIMTRAGKVSLAPARLDSPRFTLLEARHAMATAHPIVPGVTFKDVSGFSGYCVGNDGSVWSCRSKNGIGYRPGRFPWRKLSPTRRKHDGYFRAGLYADGKVTWKLVSHLVLEAFVGPRPDGKIACHFPDKDTSNNNMSNLRWDTPAANNSDQVIHGTTLKGEKNPGAKLTEAQVLEIRTLHKSGVSRRMLSEAFGVGYTAIDAIVRMLKWTHI